jgi:hypothetical protein
MPILVRTYFSLLSLFWKYMSRLMTTPLLSVCVSICISPIWTTECLNQYLLNLVSISWHPNPSQQHTSWITPINVCVCMCVLPSLLGNGSVNMFPRQWRNAEGVVFCVVRVVSEESRKLRLPKLCVFHWPVIDWLSYYWFLLCLFNTTVSVIKVT